MSFLPPLGEVYPSLDHFKLEVYSGAAEDSQAFYESSSTKSDTICEIRCVYQGPNTPCTARAQCTKVTDRKYEVNMRESIHDCNSDKEAPASQQRERMIDKRDEQLARVAEWEKADGDWGFDDLPIRMPPKKKRGKKQVRAQRKGNELSTKIDQPQNGENKADIQGDGNTEREVSQPATSKRRNGASASHLPTASNLRSAINQLETIDVESPTADELFPNLSVLLARVYAFSQRQGVLLERCTKRTTSTHKELVCSHNYREYEQVRGGRCPVVYRFNRVQNGKWTLAYPLQTHSHPIFEQGPSIPSAAIAGPSTTSNQTSHSVDETSQLSPSSSSPESSILVRLPSEQALEKSSDISRSLDSPPLPKLPLPTTRLVLDPSPQRSISPEALVRPPTSTKSPTSKRKLDDPLPPSPATKFPRLPPPDELDDHRPHESSTLGVVTHMKKEEEVLQGDSLPVAVDSKRASPAESSVLPPNCSPSIKPSTSTSLSSALATPLKSLAGEEDQDELPSIELSTFLRNFTTSTDSLASILSDLNAAGCNSLESFVTLLSIEHSPTFDRWAQALEEETRNLVKELRKDLQEFDK